ncbi:MAG TPA: RNB domain-containing ribonuclease [Candidatus Cloacimonadota bacterium]|nr:RNB domain-containing ribonuclease [Candidatus Cloacimonadota bacterium]
MNTIQPGCMALFYQAGLLVTGLVTGIEGTLLQIVSTDGASHALPAARLCLSGTEVYDSSDPQRTLGDFQEQVHQNRDVLESALKVLSEGEGRNLDAITQELGGLSDPRRFALFINLNQATQLVSHKKGLYRLLSAAERQDAELSEKQRRERQNYLDQVQAYIRDLAPNDSGQLLPPDLKRQLIAELQLLQREQSPPDLASLIRKTMPERDFDRALIEIRLALGDLSPDTDPALSISGLPVNFAASVPGYQAPGITQPRGETPEVICVDDPDSRDYDDAFSVVKTATGYRIGVHITDVAASLVPGSDLFKDVLERVSSLYLPAETVNMLPDCLAEDLLSLRAGELRAVLSLYCDVDQDSGLRDWTFLRETIRVGRNISYAELDARLSRGEYQMVKAFCDALRSERGATSQLSGNDLLYNLRVSGSRVRFKKIDFSSPARVMIEELMVLYNRLMAAKASDSDIPFLYRNISSYEDNVPNDDEDAPDQAVIPSQTGSQAYISTRPMFHPGIGAKAYLHASSPIRRVVDLINQYQFHAWLEGRPACFTQEGLDRLVPAIGKRLLLQREVVRQSERYWLLRYLKQEWLHRPLDAVFIKTSRRGCVFELLPWGKRIVVDCDITPPVSYELKLLITTVDLTGQTCRAEVIL